MSNKESFTKSQKSFVINKNKSWLNEPKSQEELVKAFQSKVENEIAKFNVEKSSISKIIEVEKWEQVDADTWCKGIYILIVDDFEGNVFVTTQDAYIIDGSVLFSRKLSGKTITKFFKWADLMIELSSLKKEEWKFTCDINFVATKGNFTLTLGTRKVCLLYKDEQISKIPRGPYKNEICYCNWADVIISRILNDYSGEFDSRLGLNKHD